MVALRCFVATTLVIVVAGQAGSPADAQSKQEFDALDRQVQQLLDASNPAER